MSSGELGTSTRYDTELYVTVVILYLFYTQTHLCLECYGEQFFPFRVDSFSEGRQNQLWSRFCKVQRLYLCLETVEALTGPWISMLAICIIVSCRLWLR